MKTLKRMLALLLVSCLLFCVVPTAFAQEPTTSVESTEQEEDIRDNPIAQGAFMEIVLAFAQSFFETIVRYVTELVEMIMEAQPPEAAPEAAPAVA